MSVDEFLSKVKPLDLIMIQGYTPYSEIISATSVLSRGNGSFTHCGIVVSNEVCDIDISGLCIMESTVTTPDQTRDVLTQRFSYGAQIRDLKKVIEEILEKGGGIAVCRLKNNPYDSNKEEVKKIMTKIYNEYFRENVALYELNIFSLFSTVFPSAKGIRDNIDEFFEFTTEKHPWIFCSEIVCIIYRDLGLLDKDIDVQIYLPVDFVDVGEDNEVNSIFVLPPEYLRKIDIETKILYRCFPIFLKTIKIIFLSAKRYLLG
jgi:hypothetical protein